MLPTMEGMIRDIYLTCADIILAVMRFCVEKGIHKDFCSCHETFPPGKELSGPLSKRLGGPRFFLNPS